MEALARVYDYLRESRVLEAERLLNPLLQEFAQDPAVHRARAALAQVTGQMDLAVEAMQTASRLQPHDAVLLMELGQSLAAAGRVEEAIAAFRRTIEIQPDLAHAWYLLGMTLYGVRRDAEALSALRQACALAPHPQLLRALAEAEYAVEHHVEALELYERIAASGYADDFGVPLRLSQCRRRLGDPAQALKIVNEGIARFPDEAPLWLELGWVREDLGDAVQAQDAYGRAHALRPDWGDPIASVIALTRGAAPQDMVSKAETLAEQAGVPEQQRAYLHYVLGKREDSRGGYAAAAAHWSSANALRRAQDGGFDRDAFAAQIDDAIAAFTPELLAARHATALRDERPVFVVGMPRSGTTLVEQVLAAHPSIHGCGERIGIVGIANSLTAQPGLRWPRDAAVVGEEWLRERALDYLESAEDVPADSRRLVDKQPYNFLHVGLLAMLFADARIVWCRRDSRDVTLSIYSESFSPLATYATDLDDIRFMIDEHIRLMRHWQAVSPLPILEMDYEAMVADTENQSRRLIDFVGMPWDDACLSFHSSGRAVQTLSRWQVRQPVHNRSVGRWRNYSQWFDGE